MLGKFFFLAIAIAAVGVESRWWMAHHHTVVQWLIVKTNLLSVIPAGLLAPADNQTDTPLVWLHCSSDSGGCQRDEFRLRNCGERHHFTTPADFVAFALAVWHVPPPVGTALEYVAATFIGSDTITKFGGAVTADTWREYRFCLIATLPGTWAVTCAMSPLLVALGVVRICLWPFTVLYSLLSRTDAT